MKRHSSRHLQRVRSNMSGTSFRLASTYLGIIMLMSIGFSIVFYNTSSHELGRQAPPGASVATDDPTRAFFNNQQPGLNTFLQQRAQQGRQDLFIKLLALNSIALVGGSVLSYYLARRTLRPIEQAMEAQVQFVSDASHELRTPLTVIQTTNDVSLRDKKLTLKQAREVIAENTEQAIRLQALSNGLLNLAKQDRDKVITSSINLQDVATAAINRIIQPAQAKNITVQDDLPNVQVVGHLEALTEIMFILLENAVKYSPEQSIITLQAQRRGRHLLVAIQDQGVGIRASDLPHIFRRFYRADSVRSTTDSQAGYGLGLSIAQKLALQQHASLSAQSEPGNGSTFTIKLRAV